MIKTKYIAMPNIIADKLLVTEYIQDQLDSSKMATELEGFLQEGGDHGDKTRDLIDAFEKMHIHS